MSNLARPPYVERMVTRLLGADWQFVGDSWNGWDIEQKTTGARIEVKQSARRQSWTASGKFKPNDVPRFDIRHRAGYFVDNGATWIAGLTRPADIYVFAWHDGFEPIASVDHRLPEQWKFYVVAEPILPATKSIGLPNLMAICGPPVVSEDLALEVANRILGLGALKAKGGISS